MGSLHSKKQLPDGSRYKVLELLGEGAFAKVMRVKDQNKNHYALKIVVAPPERLHEAEREVVILKKISGIPHVTQIHKDYSDKSSKTENLRIYIMMKLYRGGTLVDLVNSSGFVMSEDKFVPIIRQVCEGLQNIHNLQPAIVHRDIKPENIALDLDHAEPVWTLLDFGSAIYEQENAFQTKQEIDIALEELERYTTPSYRAPEQVAVKVGARITRKVDLWALGVTIYQIAYKKLPFESTLATMSGRIAIPANNTYSQAFTNLLLSLFSMDPGSRPDAAGVIAYIDQSWEKSGLMKPKIESNSVEVAQYGAGTQGEWVADFS